MRLVSLLPNSASAAMALALTVSSAMGTSSSVWAEEGVGENIYFRSCSLCHGEEGEGAMPGIPDLSIKNGPLTKPVDELVRTVAKGVERPELPTPMPPFGGDDTLTEKDLYQVLNFMKKTFVN
ncbi:MAG: cytochrome c [Alphaproteobacteria bacterium]|nr:cytochrome c [Rhodospirillales bacterium]MCW9046260.1 cytochrome c [Alphaproteobacteria bacterium]